MAKNSRKRSKKTSHWIRIELTNEQKKKLREQAIAAKFEIEEIEVSVIPNVRVKNHPSMD